MITCDDPTTLSLDELRSLRFELQHEDDVVSYVRRIAQARLDLVRARIAGHDLDSTHVMSDDELRDVLSNSLVADAGRPPRSAVGVELDPLVDELDSICSTNGFSRISDLDPSDLTDLEQQLAEFERRVSENRQQRYGVLDRLSAELVRRYRDGTAPVTS